VLAQSSLVVAFLEGPGVDTDNIGNACKFKGSSEYLWSSSSKNTLTASLTATSWKEDGVAFIRKVCGQKCELRSALFKHRYLIARI
jgi:hypothetical protein